MRSQPNARGFTLTELMVVITISAVLALVALESFRKQMTSAKSVEAFTMVQSIRVAEERWRAQNGVYLDVSQSDTWYPWDPSLSGNRSKTRTFFSPDSDSHPDNARWLSLHPTVPGPIQFGYQVRAGMPGGVMTAPKVAVTGGLTWPTPGEPWYVIQALADTDADGKMAFYLASSLNGEVYAQDDGE
jgi:prepilin-type N-terminal cleavage/methylation domain-containing protein